ncbi:MAG: glycosyltransferase family 39 protein [Ignavibacteria bacterium]|nr:glycosyltransferase family 39 protein [Ignavibacteria bacterium]
MAKFISDNKHLLLISLVNFILLYISVFTKGYGYFIDELYYIACANNPAAGYVDHPPFAPLILAVYKSVFGDSLYSVRFLAAIAASATVFLAGIITGQMGGNKTAQAIASVCIMAAPIFPVFGGFYSMNVFEPLLCGFVFYYLIKMIKENNPKYWIHTGILFGLLMLNKHTAGLCILFIILSLLFTEYRKFLFTKYFLYCIVISSLIFLPNIIWQMQNGYPSFEFYMTNVTQKNVPLPPVKFVIMQILSYNPFIAPLWVAGLVFLIFKKKEYRIFGFIFIFSFLFFMITKSSRFDRTAFAYMCVIPAGAVFVENLISKKNKNWVYAVSLFFVIAYTFIVVPVLQPYLDYETSAKLTGVLGLNTEIERGNRPLLSQLLADRIGWQEKVDMLGSVFLTLTPEERKRTIIATENYGNAGALELLGKKYGFGNIVSGHNNYFLWSKSRLEGDIVLRLSGEDSYEGLKEAFEVVDSTGVHYDNIYCTPHERNLTVFICKRPKFTKEELLEQGRYFY